MGGAGVVDCCAALGRGAAHSSHCSQLHHSPSLTALACPVGGTTEASAHTANSAGACPGGAAKTDSLSPRLPGARRALFSRTDQAAAGGNALAAVAHASRCGRYPVAGQSGAQVVRRLGRGERPVFYQEQWRDSGADRPQRRRQEHLSVPRGTTAYGLREMSVKSRLFDTALGVCIFLANST